MYFPSLPHSLWFLFIGFPFLTNLLSGLEDLLRVLLEEGHTLDMLALQAGQVGLQAGQQDGRAAGDGRPGRLLQVSVVLRLQGIVVPHQAQESLHTPRVQSLYLRHKRIM